MTPDFRERRPVSQGHSSRRFLLATASVVALAALLVITCLIVQGLRSPKGKPDYVALGSSFAAGADLGPLQSDSPFLCARSVNGYPQQLARTLKVSIVDMSCGGAVTKNVLHGGQFFQGPQIRAIRATTRLVTITVGGNDVGYIGDLSLLAARRSHSLFGWLVRSLWAGPKPVEDRDFASLERNLVETLVSIHHLAPKAVVALATYPTILPPAGTCSRLGLSAADADLMRAVAERLAQTTRSAATRGGAILVDMHDLGATHNACSSSLWTRGWINAGAAPFHPTLSGARATAEAISAATKPLL